MPTYAVAVDTMGVPIKGFAPEQFATLPAVVTNGRFICRTSDWTFWAGKSGAWVQCDNTGVAAATHIHTIADVTGLQAALDSKAPTANPTFTGTVTGVTKTHVGLGNVDNTSDAAKPVSTATQTALNGKSNTGHTHTKAEITDLGVATTAVAGLVPLATDAEAVAGTVTNKAITPANLQARIAALLAAAPAALDTLNELAIALGNDPNFATTMTNALAGKAPLVHGHVLTDGNITGILPKSKGGFGIDATIPILARGAIGAMGTSGWETLPALTAGVWSGYTDGANNSDYVMGLTVQSITGRNQIIVDWQTNSDGDIRFYSDVALPAGTYEFTTWGG